MSTERPNIAALGFAIAVVRIRDWLLDLAFPDDRMICDQCHRVETDGTFQELEECSRCGGPLFSEGGE